METADLVTSPGKSLAAAVLAGDRLSLARLLTQVENDSPQGRLALDQLFPYAGRAHLVGVTGSPGAGKSSLVNQIAQVLRSPAEGEPRTVAVVAVDPTSPFSGGALLGDRVRMRDLAGDPGVFIRSMASRGALGGLARQAFAVVQVLDAAGFDLILIETVGAGQAEVDIARLAHTTLVVEAPGMGDEIQAIKAGILEIADILVINKADRPGLESTERSLREMLEMGHPQRRRKNGPRPEDEAGWIPPVLKTIATGRSGAVEVVRAIFNHRTFLEQSGQWQQRQFERLEGELESLIRAALWQRWRAGLPEQLYEDTLVRLCERQLSPFSALEQLIELNSQ